MNIQADQSESATSVLGESAAPTSPASPSQPTASLSQSTASGQSTAAGQPGSPEPVAAAATGVTPVAPASPPVGELAPRADMTQVEEAEEVAGQGRMIGGFHGLAPRPPIAPVAHWTHRLRRFARGGIWALPLAAVSLGLAALQDWPRPGTWLELTLLSLVLALLGGGCLALLLAATPGRFLALLSYVTMVAGGVAFAAPASVAGLGGAAARAEPARSLGVGGLIALAAAWLSMGLAVLASRVLSKTDGYLLMGFVALVLAAAYLRWQFVVVIAAMVLLAAGLGLSWSAARLTPDGAPRDWD